MSEPNITTRNEFHQRYWTYYMILEKDFLATERYLTIDPLNYGAFSSEYIKQYQAICSEIDVIAKSYCKELECSFNGKSINTYCRCIVDNNPDFANRTVKLRDRDIQLTPWENWTYTMVSQKKGPPKPEADNPDWWNKYNKIKHSRTTTNNETGLPYYKLANQKNVLNALAALYQLELYYYRLLHQKHFQNDPDMPGPNSKIYEVENWGNNWVMAGADVGFLLATV